jgi:hypothetical protein
MERREQFVGVPLIQYRMVYDAEDLFPPDTGLWSRCQFRISSAPRPHAQTARRIDVGRRFSEKNSAQIFATIQDGRSAANADTYYCNTPSSVLRVGPDRGAISIQFGAGRRLTSTLRVRVPSRRVLHGAADRYHADVSRHSLRFLSWSRTPIFNRTGTLFLFGEAGDFLYEVTPSG